MHGWTGRIAVLLFGSGMCALLYQVVWLRELRLVFGASTPASAAVLAIFMGGLGLGGALLGKRADASKNPLMLYAHLELAVALAAGVSPLLLDLARAIYISLGGSLALGETGGAMARLALSALVLGIPTFLMGGTLPAAAKAAERGEDRARRNLAALYGVNTLGAVAGTLLATFSMIEVLGNRATLWMGCLCNILVAILARGMARMQVAEAGDAAPQDTAAPPDSAVPDSTVPDSTVPVPASPVPGAKGTAGEFQTPARFVYLAALVAGFAFFCLELAWYRLLTPLLGGSVYTFGLILALALVGIGLGGALYSAGAARRRPTIQGFAVTCLLEALLILLPYAAGDRLAELAGMLQAFKAWGFAGSVLGWTVVTGLVVVPPAVVAGFQFPLLIGLLGTGGEDVGRHAGRAYAWNTAGAILGSLLGGFVLLPMAGALTTWIVAALTLLLVGGLAVWLGMRQEGGAISLAAAPRPPLVLAGLAALCLLAEGPTAAWRHAPIGAGRVQFGESTANDIQVHLRNTRRHTIWEADGKEMGIALNAANGYSVINNGKSDSNTIADIATIVWSGLLGTIFHENPRSALVVGLGTGATVGWLAQVPGMERVTVVELEEKMAEAARLIGDANLQAMQNPKVELAIADAREYLLVDRRQYDLISSEPSNLYRAGIASLYTQEYYEALAARLAPGGIFAQWLQGYEMDSQALFVVHATLRAVFPYVTTWGTNPSDIVFLCSREPLRVTAAMLRDRLGREPYRAGAIAAFEENTLEALLARCIGDERFTDALLTDPRLARTRNRDDKLVLEYLFPRTAGRAVSFRLSEVWRVAERAGLDLPHALEKDLDRERIRQFRSLLLGAAQGRDTEASPGLAWREASLAGGGGDHRKVQQLFESGRLEHMPMQVRLHVAQSLAILGDARALEVAAPLESGLPQEALLTRALLAWNAKDARNETEALAQVTALTTMMRANPLAWLRAPQRFTRLLEGMGSSSPALRRSVVDLLAQPLAGRMLEQNRLRLLSGLAMLADCGLAAPILEAIEPHPFWDRDYLSHRLRCYKATNHPRADDALADLATFLKAAPPSFSEQVQANLFGNATKP